MSPSDSVVRDGPVLGWIRNRSMIIRSTVARSALSFGLCPAAVAQACNEARVSIMGPFSGEAIAGVPAIGASSVAGLGLLEVRLGQGKQRWTARSVNDLSRGEQPTRLPSPRGYPAVAEAGTAVVVAGSEEGVEGGGIS